MVGNDGGLWLTGAPGDCGGVSVRYSTECGSRESISLFQRDSPGDAGRVFNDCPASAQAPSRGGNRGLFFRLELIPELATVGGKYRSLLFLVLQRVVMAGFVA